GGGAGPAGGGAGGGGVGGLVNGPLTAVGGGSMVRLADPPSGAEVPPLATALPPMIALEAEYRREIASGLRTSGEGAAPAEFFRWSEQLGGLGGRVPGLTHWAAVEGPVRAGPGPALSPAAPRGPAPGARPPPPPRGGGRAGPAAPPPRSPPSVRSGRSPPRAPGLGAGPPRGRCPRGPRPTPGTSRSRARRS